MVYNILVGFFPSFVVRKFNIQRSLMTPFFPSSSHSSSCSRTVSSFLFLL